MLKTVVCGDVLKTTLLIRFTTNEYPEDYIPTVFDNYSFSMVVDGKQVTMVLWDTAGQEEYDRLRPLSYESTDAFVLIFDRYSIDTYENIKSRWFPELQQHAGHVPIVLVGVTIESVDPTIPQLDLITSEQGKELKQAIKAVSYLECCLRSGEGTKEVFEEAARAALCLPLTEERRMQVESSTEMLPGGEAECCIIQ